MDTIAEEYVKLVLALGQHDRDYVDAYYGPPAWKRRRRRRRSTSPRSAPRGRRCWPTLDSCRPEPARRWSALRHQYLDRQLSALAARVRMLEGERLSFDEESKALYDAVAPTLPRGALPADPRPLEKRFPGSGPLVERYDAFRRAFVIPPARSSTRCSRRPSRRAASARASTSRCRPASSSPSST